MFITLLTLYEQVNVTIGSNCIIFLLVGCCLFCLTFFQFYVLKVIQNKKPSTLNNTLKTELNQSFIAAA